MITRENAKELLPIIKAYSEGKEIEYFNGLKWENREEFRFSADPDQYRIKSEPKYRSFKNSQECWEEMHKHPDFGWVKGKQWGHYASLGCVGEIIIRSEDECHKDSFDSMYNRFTFTDGEPFGIKEEE